MNTCVKQISIWIVHVCDDFGVARAFQRVKAETSFVTNFTGWKARATLVAAAAGKSSSVWCGKLRRLEGIAR
jgi:hypothetical protein